jgi:hypothetical protein
MALIIIILRFLIISILVIHYLITAKFLWQSLAIFWKKEIDDKIKVMDEGKSRIHVIQTDTNASPICLINVYMPSDNKEMDCEYTDMISVLTC